MFMLRKLTGIFVVAALLGGILGGCAATPETESSQPDGTPSSAVSSQSSTATLQPTPDSDDVLKILAVGNSFSDDTMEYVWQILNSLGYQKVKLGTLYIGNSTLDMHASNAKGDLPNYEYRTNINGTWQTTPNSRISDALKEENWDYVTFQQHSPDATKESTFGRLKELTDYVRSYEPEAKFYWLMTWGYQSSCTMEIFNLVNRDQMKMYQEIVSTVEKKIKGNADFAGIIPNGTAIQNTRTSLVGDILTRDGYHLSFGLGRYIAGLGLVKTITGKDISSLSFAPAEVTPYEKQVAIESVNNAVKTPFQVTSSKLFDTGAKKDTLANPVVGTTYTLTGNHQGNTPTDSVDLRGNYVLSYYAIENGQLRSMTHNPDANQWYYWDLKGDIAVSLFPVQWEWSMLTIPSDYGYPVICFTAPKSGKLTLMFKGSSEPANKMEFPVTKNGIADADRLTGTEGVYEVEVKAGDRFYLHCKASGTLPTNLYGAVSSQVTYTEITD
ncbi:MAG: DUF4886 domain-containing protein [Ruminococcaceae bacterium]|nr:DUF4886 domain-containing protein [Oscillospiraceae bacterium]